MYIQPIGVWDKWNTEESARWWRNLKNGLERICPCVAVDRVRGSLQRAIPGVKGADTPGMELTVAVNRELTDVTSFCACLAKHSGGCRLLLDLMKSDGTVVFRHGNGKNTWRNGVLTWDPSLASPHPSADPVVSLVHELTHAWLAYVETDYPIGQLVPRVPGYPAYRPRMGEAFAVRGENQVAIEMLGANVGSRLTYDYGGVPYPLPDPTFLCLAASTVANASSITLI